MFALVSETNHQVVGFDPEQKTWICVDSLPSHSNRTLQQVAETAFNWINGAYDPDDVEISLPIDADRELHLILPKKPLESAYLPWIEALSAVDTVHQAFYVDGTGEIVGVLTAQVTAENFGGFVLANYGFNPTRSLWEFIEHHELELQMEIPDPASLGIFEWLQDAYSAENLRVGTPHV